MPRLFASFLASKEKKLQKTDKDRCKISVSRFPVDTDRFLLKKKKRCFPKIKIKSYCKNSKIVRRGEK